MSAARTAAATARRRADSEHKRQRVLTVAGAFIDRGQDFSWEQLARAAQVNPGFVHRAPGLKAEIEALRGSAAVELEAGLRSGTAITVASVNAENTFSSACCTSASGTSRRSNAGSARRSDRQCSISTPRVTGSWASVSPSSSSSCSRPARRCATATRSCKLSARSTNGS